MGILQNQDYLPTSTVFKEGLPVKMYTGNSNFWEKYRYCRLIEAETINHLCPAYEMKKPR